MAPIKSTIGVAIILLPNRTYYFQEWIDIILWTELVDSLSWDTTQEIVHVIIYHIHVGINHVYHMLLKMYKVENTENIHMIASMQLDKPKIFTLNSTS